MAVGANNTTDSDLESPFSEYPPAAFKCIAMMSLGYLSGRLGLLAPSEAEGINKFASYWALPSLLYLMVAAHDASSIRWQLILALLVGKLILFIVIAVFCMLIRLHKRQTMAYFYAGFCTVTNDAGLGNVLVQGLCAKKCSELPVHLFYIQPISMLLMYSLAFSMMRNGDVRRRQFFKDSFKAVWKTAKNRLILAFVAGLITNASLRHSLPYYFRYLLEVIIAAFPANVLFLLGISMVGKFRVLSSACCSNYNSWIPFMTFFIKMVATPIFLHVVVNNFAASDENKEFAFLYGVMSPSMQAVSIAKEYDIPAEPVASTLALLNLLFLPLSYVAAKAALDSLDVEIMKTCLFYISVTSLLLSVTAIVIMCCKRRGDHSKTIVTWLSICQVTLALGVILKFSIEPSTFIIDVDEVMVFTGQVTCHIWTANLTAFLYLNCRFKVKKTMYLLLIGFGIPAFLTACVLIFSVHLPSDKLPFTLAYERNWLIVCAVATGCSLITTVTFLCLTFRYVNSTAFMGCAENQEQRVYAIPVRLEDNNHTKNTTDHAERAETDRNATRLCRCENENASSESIYSSYFNKDMFGFTVILCVLMFQTLIAQLLKLSSGASKGVITLVEFLSLAGNFGQGIITFFWFGFNFRRAIASLKQRWRTLAEVFSNITLSLRRRSRRVDISR